MGEGETISDSPANKELFGEYLGLGYDLDRGG